MTGGCHSCTVQTVKILQTSTWPAPIVQLAAWQEVYGIWPHDVRIHSSYFAACLARPHYLHRSCIIHRHVIGSVPALREKTSCYKWKSSNCCFSASQADSQMIQMPTDDWMGKKSERSERSEKRQPQFTSVYLRILWIPMDTCPKLTWIQGFDSKPSRPSCNQSHCCLFEFSSSRSKTNMSNLDFCGAPAPCAYAMFFSEISSCKAPGCGLQDAVRQNWKVQSQHLWARDFNLQMSPCIVT